MTKFASELPDFSDLLQASAQSRKIPAAISEKDYYLTRALRALAEAHGGQFVLKGGTSLSKGWKLLQRLSEDIDLLVNSEGGWGKGRKDRRLKELEATIAQTDGFTLAEPVREAETGVHRTASFAYPAIANDLPGLSKTIKLEMGYRGQGAEAVRRPIQSMVAEFAASRGQAGLADDLRTFEIDVQSLCRTFVEKLFAAHAAYAKDRAAGKARHYYDLHEMCKLQEVRAFVGTADYRKCVTEVRRFSEETFTGQALPEADSFSASAAFQPGSNGLKELDRNYKLEAGLFFTEQPPLGDVLQTIGALLPEL